MFHYERIKILTKDGEKYANVTLPFVSTSDVFLLWAGANDKTLDEITGRTIHADGTIIPFTGKPYLKVLEKGQDVKVQERVFTLPDVEVGSIIEYRYATRIADNIYEAPDWYIQGELYVKHAHYVWYPTSREHPGQPGADYDDYLVPDSSSRCKSRASRYPAFCNFRETLFRSSS